MSLWVWRPYTTKRRKRRAEHFPSVAQHVFFQKVSCLRQNNNLGDKKRPVIVCVSVCGNTFRDGDVAAQVMTPKQSLEGHILETNPLQFWEALQGDGLEANSASWQAVPSEVTLRANTNMQVLKAHQTITSIICVICSWPVTLSADGSVHQLANTCSSSSLGSWKSSKLFPTRETDRLHGRNRLQCANVIHFLLWSY